ncbi:MAG TPA: hypothetical protein VF707_02250 [Ardenticatenaceae bacterium]|jgi:hypothetical protein
MDEAMSTLSMNTQQRQAAIQQQLAGVDLASKDADTAFLIELIGGIVGFLGVGYIYSGLTNAGLVRLIGNWVFWAVTATFFGICATLTLGFGACLFLPLIPIPFVIAYMSANDLKKSLQAAKAGMPAASYGTTTGTTTGYLGTGTTSVPPMPTTPTRTESPVERDPNDTF